MIDQRSYQLLQDVIRRLGRSLLQYADESFPWSKSANGAVVGPLRNMIREERDAAGELSRHLSKHRLTPPYLGAYPSYFTSYNYLTMVRLLVLLVEHQKRDITQLSIDLKSLQDGESRALLYKIVEMKRSHLRELEALTDSQPPGGKAPVAAAG